MGRFFKGLRLDDNEVEEVEEEGNDTDGRHKVVWLGKLLWGLVCILIVLCGLGSVVLAFLGHHIVLDEELGQEHREADYAEKDADPPEQRK